MHTPPTESSLIRKYFFIHLLTNLSNFFTLTFSRNWILLCPSKKACVDWSAGEGSIVVLV